MRMCARPRCPRTFFFERCVPSILDDASLNDVSPPLKATRRNLGFLGCPVGHLGNQSLAHLTRHMDLIKYAQPPASMVLS